MLAVGARCALVAVFGLYGGKDLVRGCAPPDKVNFGGNRILEWGLQLRALQFNNEHALRKACIHLDWCKAMKYVAVDLIAACSI